MKNIIVRVIVAIIFIFCIIIPVFALAMNNTNDTVTPIISEELGTLSEITTVVEEEKTTNPYKMFYTFDEKVSLICTKNDREPTTEPVTEVTVIEEPTYLLTATSPKISSTTETYIVTTPEPESTTTASAETEESTTAAITYYSGKYDAAHTVWNYLRSLGYNQAICAGIIGNMMSECGGHTLALQWWCYDSGYYGICQWYTGYYPSIYGTDLMTQLNFLASTIKQEFDNFGFNYYSGFNYNAFLQIDNYYDAAIAFAKCYERCAAWTYDSRTSNAYKAYQYFVG